MHYNTFAANYTTSHTRLSRSQSSYHVARKAPVAQGNGLPYPPSFQPDSSSSSSLRRIGRRSEQTKHAVSQIRRTAADVGPNYNSPFRSVRRMKEPFQLVLPASPSFDNIPSGKDTDNNVLQSWCSNQNPATRKVVPVGLLPSPSLSDSDASTSSAWTCSTLEGRRRETCVTSTTATAHSSPVDRCEPSDRQSEDNAPSLKPFSITDSNGKRSLSYDSASTWRTDSDTVSSEASRIPSSLSYYERWLHIPEQDEESTEANRRKFQIVQKSPSPPDEIVVRLAIASRTKPRLVHISQHLSPVVDYNSRPAQPLPIPSTPDQCYREVSAFSPDTPTETSPSGSTGHDSCQSWDGYQDGREEENMNSDSESLNSGSVTSTGVCESPVPTSGRSCSPHRRDSHPNPSEIFQPQTFSPCMSDRELLEKWWDHEWTLDQLEHSIRNFPDPMLRLTSPVIVFLRQSNEKALIRPFREIFPGASENLLDCLCAILIGRNYLVSLSSTHRSRNCLCHGDYLSSIEFDVPDKTRSTCGIRLPDSLPEQIRDRILRSRSLELRKRLDSILDKLLFGICGRSDETLKTAVLVLAQVLESKA